MTDVVEGDEKREILRRSSLPANCHQPGSWTPLSSASWREGAFLDISVGRGFSQAATWSRGPLCREGKYEGARIRSRRTGGDLQQIPKRSQFNSESTTLQCTVNAGTRQIRFGTWQLDPRTPKTRQYVAVFALDSRCFTRSAESTITRHPMDVAVGLVRFTVGKNQMQ